ncbi:hypothetical protein MBLNU230_g4017t1 [Neophaeotheca triangularis]
MAGIEQIVVHSKSYIVRWINVPEHQSISWSIQPQRKSINFGIFKHPGTKNGLTPNFPQNDTLDSAPTTPAAIPADGSHAGPSKTPRRGSVTRNDTSTVVEKLQGIGLRPVAWNGRCDADIVSMGRYDVVQGEGGMYGLVFDNTFSKNVSKTVTFVLMTHPTNAPPKPGHHLHYSQAFAGSQTATGKGTSPSLPPTTVSSESLPQDAALHKGILEDPRPRSASGKESKGQEGSSFYTGVLHKKRRKKGQGYAKRFFSLDFTSSTLSYYQNRHSSALRGAVPLSLAAIGANEKTREFSIDSGAEVWHLKASNRKEFDGWRNALEQASENATLTVESEAPSISLQSAQAPRLINPAEDSEWARVEQLVSKVAGTRDAVRGFAKDTDPKYAPAGAPVGLGLRTAASRDSVAGSPSETSSASYFPETDGQNAEKRPFWKRKPSASTERSPSGLFKRTPSNQLTVPSPSTSMPPPPVPQSGSLAVPKRGRTSSHNTMPEEDVHERCMALLRDLDHVVADFSSLIAQSKARRHPPLPRSNSRLSIDSVASQEFFDAEDGGRSPSYLLNIRRGSDEDEVESPDEPAADAGSDVNSEASSDDEEDSTADSSMLKPSRQTQHSLFPRKPAKLSPLPLDAAPRRQTLQPPKQAPPSIIAFLRKNAGKDLSTVSMPVTANEPTSLLQRLAEGLEYSHLLDTAASSNLSPIDRLLFVTVFAVTGFAYNRVKERAIRKPFNPMLGETYELVRPDLGWRFVAEKVSHHPVRAACQAESLENGGWTFTQSPQPVQKFWGKSVELNTEGRARVVLHSPNDGNGDFYSWSTATCYLRNVIAGEKYVEPVQSMTVLNETSGARAVVSFKPGSMFSGRSEDVSIAFFDARNGSGDQTPLALSVQGKWTDSLKRSDTGETVWTAGPLVANAAKNWGFTAFAAALNEVSAIEEGKLPPTDSRLRPDQKAFENGEIDKAEGLKARLEERQRARRKVLEGHGQAWEPRFFEPVEGGDGEGEVWVLKEGEKGGYWGRRERRDWDGVGPVFET